MCRMLGFILFWIAVGLFISLFIESVLLNIVIIILLMVIGFNMFCY